MLFTIVNCQICIAVSLTSHRIFLDKEHRTESFVIFNRQLQAENCQLSLQDYRFDKAGNMGKVIVNNNGVLPKNSVKNLVRFSPKKFEIKGGASQTVRFSLRRKANALASEYLSYLSINCGKSFAKQTDRGLIALSPRLVHKVPIVARTGKLSAKINFSEIHLDNEGKLAFKLNRSGSRSIYGVLEIINQTNDKRVNYLQGVSVYVPSDYRKFDFALPEDIDVNTLRIRFTEDKKYGGNLSITTDINL